MQIIKKILFTFAIGLFGFAAVSIAQVSTVSTHARVAHPRLSQQPNVAVFINKMVHEHGFSKRELTVLFDQVTIETAILNSIQNPKESTNTWGMYRKQFLNSERVNKGLIFWKNNQAALKHAEREFGVPASIIVAILGVETDYGVRQGKYRVIDALSTLAFDYPPRSAFFTKELEHYLLMTRENGIDPRHFKGSYAGAMGQPQFMPSSYRSFATSYRGQSYKNLQTSTEDAIVSVANYFKHNGWHKNGLVAMPAKLAKNVQAPLHSSPLKPEKTVLFYKKQGIRPAKSVSPETKATLIVLNSGTTPQSQELEYWLGFQNFYAITRYNPSINYAMAVFQLSQLLEKKHHNNH